MARRGYGFGEFSRIHKAMFSFYSIVLMRLPCPYLEKTILLFHYFTNIGYPIFFITYQINPFV